jgi:putative ATPase
MASPGKSSRKSSSSGGDLFGAEQSAAVSAATPLAARFRPRTLDQFVGQEHLLAPGKPLRRLIESDRLSSLILFGPPGVGKTSLAEVIAHTTKSRFERLSGVESTVADLRRVLAEGALRLRQNGERTVLFMDEIHRFNKAQQDVLLPDVESGSVRLIGATTHNPSFYINGPLVSRSQVFALEPLDNEALSRLLDAAIADPERGLGKVSLELQPDAREHLLAVAEGDARRLLNGLELAALTTLPGQDGKIIITLRDMEECVQKKRVLYDRDEDQHYDTISAFIKSVRGSDPDSSLYWLAKMIEAGEDPRFIARRLVILAAEDIGLADPRGIMVAVAAHQAVEFIGMPEGRIPLAEATVYLATAPKSNKAYLGIESALEAVRKETQVAVPKHLRNAPTKLMKELGYHKGYQYAHDFEGAIVPQEHGVPAGSFYQPSDYGYEKQVRERLDYWKSLRDKKKNPCDD